MTEIQIKNLIKEYEKEYIEFMEIEKLPQYKIDFFEINVEESDAAGFASAAQAYYNTKTDEHILRICKSSEIPRYIVFHEFTHILDTEMYAKQDSWKYMALSGYTEYHAAQVELMIMLGADSIQTQDFSFTVDVEIGNSTVRNYLNSRHQLVVNMMNRTDFPRDIEALKTTVGVLYNYFGVRSICKMYAKDYTEEVDNTIIIQKLSKVLFEEINTLGEFAPEFAHFNDDVLFGENWNNQDIDVKTRSIITVVALMASGITDSSLKYHLQNAKNHGVTQKEIAAVITHVAFYAGWPKAWAVFNLAKEVWEAGEGDLPYEEEAMRAHAKEMVFPIGAPNDGFAQYFSGRSFLAPISTSQVGIFNVTFEPGCRNNWHIHHAKSGGGQILVCVAGRGFYQEEGRDAVEMKPGDCINIPVDVKHWHGAAPDEWFSHLAIEVPGVDCSNEWCEAVSEKEYAGLR